MKSLAVVLVVCLSGCASFDAEEFNRGLQQGLRNAYIISVATDRSAHLNAQASRQMQAMNAGLLPNAMPAAPPPPVYSATDTDWDWDEFYVSGGQSVWMCRGVQSGEYAADRQCALKLKTDLRWPQK